MTRLPLFPLNTVLFPGVPLNLHIFEPRYREMIGYCLAEKQPFGVVLIRKGAEALGPLADPHPIGCSAAIIEHQPLADGRMNIAAVGVERFRVVSLDRAGAYLVGEVDSYPVKGRRDAGLPALADRLRPWVDAYLRALAEAVPGDIEAAYLPSEPVALAYIAAYLVQAPAAQKQKLLEAASMAGMLSDLEGLYRRELAILKALIEGEEPPHGAVNLN